MTKADIPALVVAALKPFAEVTDCDIGYDEADEDIFMPMSAYNARAPLLTVGDLRRARTALAALAALSRTPGEAGELLADSRIDMAWADGARTAMSALDKYLPDSEAVREMDRIIAQRQTDAIAGRKAASALAHPAPPAAPLAALASGITEENRHNEVTAPPAAPAGEIEARELDEWAHAWIMRLKRETDERITFGDGYFSGALDVLSKLRSRLASPAPGAIAPGVEALRQAILKATEDEVNGKPNGNIIVKGCAAAEYVDPEDAAMTFMEEIAHAVLAAIQPALSTAERDATERERVLVEALTGLIEAEEYGDAFEVREAKFEAARAAIRSGEKA